MPMTMLLARKNSSDWLKELVFDWLKLNIFDQTKYTTMIGLSVIPSCPQTHNFNINCNTLLSRLGRQNAYWLEKNSSDWLKELVFDWLKLNCIAEFILLSGGKETNKLPPETNKLPPLKIL